MSAACRYYCVAGFSFRVKADAALLDGMENLAPFEIPGQARNDDEFLFTLEQGPDFARSGEPPVFCTEDGPECPEMAIFELAKRYLFRVRPLPCRPVAVWMEVDQGFSQARFFLSGTDNAFGLNSALLIMLAFGMAIPGALEIQASVVMYKGLGYLFLGPDGTGRSSHSRLWLENLPGAELLNDDYPILRVMPDGSARVYGTPWSGRTPCFKPVSVPVGAVVRLSLDQRNSISRLSRAKAFDTLMVAAAPYRPFPPQVAGLHRTLQQLAETVPCYSFRGLPSVSAVHFCRQAVCEDP